jgi:branched-chain amino acid transport system ATP-binding protein
MRRDAVVEAEKLSVHFGGVDALDRVNFSLKAGELRCLIGPNGAGKSTFFKCLTGQLRPHAGRVFIKGEDVSGWPPFAIARLGVGIKTQVPSVMNGSSVRENLWLAARRLAGAKEADRRVAETLDRLRLGHLAASDVASLSHGQRQLAELGIVMAGKPWLILLDEPAAGLTGEDRARMAELMAELNRDAAMIVVEHDMHFIRAIAKIVTVFHQGRVLIEAPVETVLTDSRVRDVYLGRQAA